MRTLGGPKHSGQFGGAAPDALLTLIRALSTLHDDNGDVAVEGLRREEWTGASYTDDEFRELAEIEPGLPFLGTGGLGERIWSGPAITVTGLDAQPVDRALNAVVPFARAKISLRIHPEQNPFEAQVMLMRHLEVLRPFGIALEIEPAETGKGFAPRTDGPAYDAARAALSTAWGAETVSIATGGSIPLVDRARRGRPRGGDAADRRDRRVREHPRAERARPRRRAREGDRGRGGVLPRVRRARRGVVSEPATPAAAAEPEHTFLERILDGIERVGNKMPHPAILFLVALRDVIVLSQVLYWFDVKATFEVVKPPPVSAEET